MKFLSPASFDILIGQVLLFPVLVVITAVCCFLCGGSCDLWQWWVSVACMLVYPFVYRQWKDVCISNVFFLFIIALLWLFDPLSFDNCWNNDVSGYHLPMVRLLIKGWNPVSDPLATGICDKLGLDLWGMRPYHVAFTSKPVAIFNAVAFNFVRDPLAVTYPAMVFLLVGVMLQLVKIGGVSRVAYSIIAFCAIYHFIPERSSIDSVFTLATAGLLFTMYDDLNKGIVSWLPLFVFSFWMINAKLPGALGCAVFICVYIFAKLKQDAENRNKMLWRTFACAIALSGLSCIASFNPYLTSWRDYGHPLYPFKTVDAKRYPVRDITWDFDYQNDDMRTLGRVGALINAYVSPDAIQTYYNKKLGRSDFSPHIQAWGDYRSQLPNCPTTFNDRIVLWLTLCVLACLPNTRYFALMLLILIVAFPRNYIGFLRYQPWVQMSTCLAGYALMMFFIKHLSDRWQKAMQFMGLIVIACCGLLFIKRQGDNINLKYTEITSIPKILFCPPLFSEWESYPHDIREKLSGLLDNKKTNLNNLILLSRELPKGIQYDVVLSQCGESTMWFSPFGYEADLQRPLCNECKKWKFFRTVNSTFHAWFINYPRLLTKQIGVN